MENRLTPTPTISCLVYFHTNLISKIPNILYFVQQQQKKFFGISVCFPDCYVDSFQTLKQLTIREFRKMMNFVQLPT